MSSTRFAIEFPFVFLSGLGRRARHKYTLCIWATPLEKETIRSGMKNKSKWKKDVESSLLMYRGQSTTHYIAHPTKNVNMSYE